MKGRAFLARRAGFTLLESLVVLGLLALMAGMSSQLLRPPSGRMRLEAATRGFCATLRATRARAIAVNGETSVIVDLAAKRWRSPVGEEGRLPADAAITLDIAKTQQFSAREGGIAFFPDGGSSGADIAIVSGDARASIDVNWLTGRVRCGVS